MTRCRRARADVGRAEGNNTWGSGGEGPGWEATERGWVVWREHWLPKDT